MTKQHSLTPLQGKSNSTSDSEVPLKFKKPKSIQWQLICSLLLVLPLVSVIISIVTAVPLYLKLNDEDDQDLQRLAMLLMNDLQENNNTQEMLDQDPTQALEQAFDEFYIDDSSSLATDTSVAEQFIHAIWDTNGQLIESEGEAVNILTLQRHPGFMNTDMRFKANAWRVYYYTDAKSGVTVAAAQKWRYRLQYMTAMVAEQLKILLVTLPFLILILIWSVRRGLRPLNALANALHQRHAHDLALMTRPVPTELQPLIDSLNQLFTRVSDTINREQRFTADAAHELRSPITAIKLQANELAFSLAGVQNQNDAHTALQRIQQVANRASHLIDQLLTLSQLDNSQQGSHSNQDNQNTSQNLQTSPQQDPIDWLQVSEEALQSVSLSAREQGVQLKRHQLSESPEHVLPIRGDATLLTLLLRNLLDNAIRYGSAGNMVNSDVSGDINGDISGDVNNSASQPTLVELTLADDVISVRDHGKGIDEENLARVKERFFRPAGQKQMGSGLGLSIVERIAELHHLTFSLDNHVDGGVIATIRLVS